ncbi:MAG: Mannitol dehydrogenase domain protein [Nocardioides sp.]|nr:Mannitol dehydrogenase domain protein [Nocardioides sp.]
MLPLSDTTLRRVSRRVDVPRYDRSRLVPSIVHLGVGGFHRAHQAVYLDDLARRGATAWGEVGVGLRSPGVRSALSGQDSLFTVVQRDSDGASARVVGAMCDYVYGGDEPQRVVERLADERTRIVTMTITGDAYRVGADGTLDHTDPEVARDLADPGSPRTWVGHLTEALARRRQAGDGGFTVLSCDNLADSGATTRAALVGYARLRDETLARWIERHVSFPDSMVDRITPGSDDALRDLVAREYGVRDRLPVATEPFTQWVVEDDFCQGRPPLEDVGVQVVGDVAPYKLVKTRLLNGAHTAMAYLAWLAGHRTSAETVADPVLRAFVVQLLRDEVAPLLPRVPGMDADAYVDTVMARLDNVAVADPLARLCRRGSTKVPAYVLPSLVEARAQGRPSPLLTLAVAGWFRYLQGTDLEGAPIEVTDARLEALQPVALRGGTDPRPLLDAMGAAADLRADGALVQDLTSALQDLELGVRTAVRRRLSGPSTRPTTRAVTAGAHPRLDIRAGLIS